MSKPAAHLGSAMRHRGGKIAAGEPTVLIGGKPAARMGDPHACPMSDGPKPHVGGVIAQGSRTVRIGNKPAARVGDRAQCMGPPNAIAQGEPTVLIGD